MSTPLSRHWVSRDHVGILSTIQVHAIAHSAKAVAAIRSYAPFVSAPVVCPSRQSRPITHSPLPEWWIGPRTPTIKRQVGGRSRLSSSDDRPRPVERMLHLSDVVRTVITSLETLPPRFASSARQPVDPCCLAKPNLASAFLCYDPSKIPPLIGTCSIRCSRRMAIFSAPE